MIELKNVFVHKIETNLGDFILSRISLLTRERFKWEMCLIMRKTLKISIPPFYGNYVRQRWQFGQPLFVSGRMWHCHLEEPKFPMPDPGCSFVLKTNGALNAMLPLELVNGTSFLSEHPRCSTDDFDYIDPINGFEEKGVFLESFFSNATYMYSEFGDSDEGFFIKNDGVEIVAVSMEMKKTIYLVSVDKVIISNLRFFADLDTLPWDWIFNKCKSDEERLAALDSCPKPYHWTSKRQESFFYHYWREQRKKAFLLGSMDNDDDDDDDDVVI